jgi:hypothetical protein
VVRGEELLGSFSVYIVSVLYFVLLVSAGPVHLLICFIRTDAHVIQGTEGFPRVTTPILIAVAQPTPASTHTPLIYTLHICTVFA